MVEDETLEQEIERRSKSICISLGKDPNKILDPYGPAKQWDAVAYHLCEIEFRCSEKFRSLADDPAMVERATYAAELATIELQGRGVLIKTGYNDTKFIVEAVLRAIGGVE